MDVHRDAVATLFNLLDRMCEGAITVDRDARVVWINDKYRALLGIGDGDQVLGRDVEEIIPESQMRRVVATGRPVLLDIMRFGERHFVVTRLPLRDEQGNVTGGVGFVLYDRLDHLKPLLSRFEELQAELKRTRQALAAERRAKYSFAHFIGRSPALQEVKRQARRVAARDSPVLLLGETGTGKELLAQAIHAASRRANQPFVAINVAAVPETLLEAEFFGVVPGAFTGADRKGREGKFKIADGGTLFLDEIGDMPLDVQAKLLRALQEQEIEPLGSNRIQRVDVRVIAATSHDLERRVATGAFRADLFYRLNVVPIRLPPLREHAEDVAPLVEVLIEDIAARNALPPLEVSDAALSLLERYPWPGNVRELGNVLERACLLSEEPELGTEVFASILPQPATDQQQGRGDGVRPLSAVVAETERTALLQALRASGGRKAAAAKLLGISRSKLYDKLAQHGLSAEATGPSDSWT